MIKKRILWTKFGNITYQETWSGNVKLIELLEGRFVGKEYDILISTLADGERNYEVVNKLITPPQQLPADYDSKEPIDVHSNLQSLEKLLNNPDAIDEKAETMLSMLQFAYAESNISEEADEESFMELK